MCSTITKMAHILFRRSFDTNIKHSDFCQTLVIYIKCFNYGTIIATQLAVFEKKKNKKKSKKRKNKYRTCKRTTKRLCIFLVCAIIYLHSCHRNDKPNWKHHIQDQPSRINFSLIMTKHNDHYVNKKLVCIQTWWWMVFIFERKQANVWIDVISSASLYK